VIQQKTRVDLWSSQAKKTQSKAIYFFSLFFFTFFKIISFLLFNKIRNLGWSGSTDLTRDLPRSTSGSGLKTMTMTKHWKGYSGSLPLIWGLKFNGHGTNCPIKIFEKIIKDYITWDLHSPCCFLLFPWESHLQSANLTQTIQILPPSTQKLASASLVSEALIRCFQPCFAFVFPC